MFIYNLLVLKLYMGGNSALPFVLRIHHGTHFMGKTSWLRCDKYRHYQLFSCEQHGTSFQTLLGNPVRQCRTVKSIGDSLP